MKSDFTPKPSSSCRDHTSTRCDMNDLLTPYKQSPQFSSYYATPNNESQLCQKLHALELELSQLTDEKSACIDVQEALSMSMTFKNLEHPSLRWCAFCASDRCTEITYVPTDKTLLASLGLLLTGCFALPYMTNHCQKPKVICSKCRRDV